MMEEDAAMLSTGLDLGARRSAPFGAALGVLRGSVDHRLHELLRMARRLAGGALVAATMMSIPGVPTPPAVPAVGAAVRDGATGAARREQRRDAGAPSPASPTASAAAAGLPARILAHVAGRMPGHAAATHERVAGAIVAESALAGVDPLLVLAMIEVESTFDPDAVSDHGAVGLMQVKGRTMHDVLTRSGLPPADARDPVANVQAGVRYLGHLVASFDALDEALMAYNAGPTRIRGHIRGGEVPRRYRVYPQKVRNEMTRLQRALGGAAPAA